MHIILKKGSPQQSTSKSDGSKRSVITISRSDGTKDWAYIHPGLQDHDIAHYAVESILEMKNGFFGIIDKGARISDFELPKDQKGPLAHPDTMDIEAIQAEYIVNQLQTEIWNTGMMQDFIDVMKESLRHKNIPYPTKLTQETLKKIRKVYHHYTLEFHAMGEGEELVLDFNG